MKDFIYEYGPMEMDRSIYSPIQQVFEDVLVM